jgi:hypothetical protein
MRSAIEDIEMSRETSGGKSNARAIEAIANAMKSDGPRAPLKAKRARSGASDAPMSLWTYDHAPLASGMHAEFNLSPLFGVLPTMAEQRVTPGRSLAINL